MGYLASEIFVFLLAAFALGLGAGWWIWSRSDARQLTPQSADSALATKLEMMQKTLEECQSARQQGARELTQSRAALSNAQTQIASLEADLAKLSSQIATPRPAAPDDAALPPATTPESETPSNRPQGPFLDAPVGAIDDLKLIKGIGPKLAKTLNALGVYHFSQIAQWSDTDVTEVDEKLQFKGRVTRDGWVEQAKRLSNDE